MARGRRTRAEKRAVGGAGDAERAGGEGDAASRRGGERDGESGGEGSVDDAWREARGGLEETAEKSGPPRAGDHGEPGEAATGERPGTADERAHTHILSLSLHLLTVHGVGFSLPIAA